MPLAGFIKLHRSLLDWEWHDDSETLSVWIHLLLLANYKPTEWHQIPLKPGQLITSRDSLAKATGLSERKIRTALTRLKSSGCLTIESTNRYTLISLVNFGFFQGLNDETGQQNDQQIDRPTTSQRPQRNKDKKDDKCIESRKRFSPPSVDEVAAYCRERGNTVDAQTFCDFYAAKGWRVGAQPMKDWRAAVRTWEKREGGGHAAGRMVMLDELLKT